VFPDLPHPGYTWRLNHHMGIVTSTHLYHILWAANEFARNDDPAANINHYLIVNAQLTPNVREDSGQPDAWRDYQQILSELGLIFSLEVTPQITLTPLGLALLDGSMGFSEIITLQALRFQYPNGHHMQMSPAQRTELQGTQYAAVRTFAELQYRAGVQLRPAVLAWRVLRRLSERNSAAELSVDEFESYLMRCSTNPECAACADAIIAARGQGVVLARLGPRQRRNTQDWMKFLRLTTIFTTTDDRQPVLSLSNFGSQHATEIDDICTALESPATFWEPGTISQADRLRWYSEFGGVDLSIPELPETEPEAEAARAEFVAGEEKEDDRIPENLPEGGTVELRAFQAIELPEGNLPPNNLTIQSVYSAELTRTAHRLHDQMVLLIAQTCQAKGATVFDDPDSVDLLVQHHQREFIVEVKSVTPRNFIARLRYALGQVLHYDFLRSANSQLPRRKVIAFTANVPENSWSVRLLNNHLDMDLLTLESGKLRIHSLSEPSTQLFG
jgi:hypothetical protein